jgi:hypothetical protein
MFYLTRSYPVLPLELMHIIIEYTDRNTAVVACRVCRSWLPKALSVAWRHVSWKGVVGKLAGVGRLDVEGEEWAPDTQVGGLLLRRSSIIQGLVRRYLLPLMIEG